MEVTADLYIKNRHLLEPNTILQYMADRHTNKLDELMQLYFDSQTPSIKKTHGSPGVKKKHTEDNIADFIKSHYTTDEDDEYHRGFGFDKPPKYKDGWQRLKDQAAEYRDYE